jgi:hypothetical protein
MLNTDLQPGNYITVTPKGERVFEVAAIDDLSSDMVFVWPIDGRTSGQWVFTTFARIVSDEPDMDCHCGHPECGAC